MTGKTAAAAMILLCTVVAAPASALADAQLDQMMRDMYRNQYRQDHPPSSTQRRIPLEIPQSYKDAWNALASRVSEANAALRSEFSLLDYVETDLGNLWDQTQADLQELDYYPFPHANPLDPTSYEGVPGIVGDATDDVMTGARAVMNPDDSSDQQ